MWGYDGAAVDGPSRVMSYRNLLSELMKIERRIFTPGKSAEIVHFNNNTHCQINLMNEWY